MSTHQPLPKRGLWSSRLGFILASAGSAVGLGNIWKFPYIAGKHGGGAFVLFFILCILIVGIPIMIAEMVIGRHTRRDPVGAFRTLRPRSLWVVIGWLGVVAGFVILSYYCVVAGWAVDYLWLALKGTFSGNRPENMPAIFDHLMGSGTSQIFWQAVFMALTIWIVLGGVSGGLERANKIMMPLLYLILITLAIYGLTRPGSSQALSFLFTPDWQKLDPPAMLEALGHAFFSLSLGMGAMLTYGSYADHDTNIPTVAITVSVMDTLVAILSSIAFFSIIFTFGMEPAAGAGLAFKTLPIIFTQIPGGTVVAILFFLLLIFAALTSSISLLEVVVAYYVDERKWGRKEATVAMGFIIFLLGIPSALSSNLLAEVRIGGLDFFTLIDLVATNYILPVGGLGIAVFTGWVLTTQLARNEVERGEIRFHLYPVWHFLIRYVCPVLVALVLLNTTGFFHFIGVM